MSQGDRHIVSLTITSYRDGMWLVNPRPRNPVSCLITPQRQNTAPEYINATLLKPQIVIRDVIRIEIGPENKKERATPGRSLSCFLNITACENKNGFLLVRETMLFLCFSRLLSGSIAAQIIGPCPRRPLGQNHGIISSLLTRQRCVFIAPALSPLDSFQER